MLILSTLYSIFGYYKFLNHLEICNKEFVSFFQTKIENSDL